MPTKQEVRDANIKMHTVLGDAYDKEPHYKPENVKRVSSILKDLQAKTWGDSLLDIGCGRGFVIDIARKYFRVIRGIDITPAMLKKVNIKSTVCDINVMECPSDAICFPDNYFDVCTAYALLHHLDEIDETIKEAYRVLKHGGVLYTDLDPNYYFWEALNNLPKGNYGAIIDREVKSVVGDVFEVEDGVDKETLILAENLKYTQGGFKESDLRNVVMGAGFSECTINYNWFLGEASITHGAATRKHVKEFQDYMQNILPLSRHLFKYLSIIAIKE